jgi:hypothetical protein
MACSLNIETLVYRLIYEIDIIHIGAEISLQEGNFIIADRLLALVKDISPELQKIIVDTTVEYDNPSCLKWVPECNVTGLLNRGISLACTNLTRYIIDNYDIDGSNIFLGFPRYRSNRNGNITFIAKYLLERGLLTSLSLTESFWGCRYWYQEDLELIKFLIEHGVINVAHCRRLLYNAMKEGDIIIINILLGHREMVAHINNNVYNELKLIYERYKHKIIDDFDVYGDGDDHNGYFRDDCNTYLNYRFC